MQKSREETTLTAIFDAKGIIHHEFVREKQILNGKFHKEMIKRLVARVHRVRPEFQESESWYLMRCTAPADSSGAVSEFLAKRGDPVLSHPPSPLIYHRLTIFYSLN
jgi:hypothetical protein